MSALSLLKILVSRPIRYEESSRGIKYPLRLHISPYAISLSLSLSIILLFLNSISFSFPPEESPKISSSRKRKRAYSGNGKCFFRSAEQSECWSWEGTRLKSVAAQQRDFSFPRGKRAAFALRSLPFPQAMHSGCRKSAIKSLIH